mmetsp:Transcript_30875/g.51010  ORF Transcript_30875/g.51010 Transcript_30875/m.51010 type:complete len:275 (+) Transcript_30875:23-847(+)
MLSALPVDLWWHLLPFVSLLDATSLMSTCKKVEAVISDDSVYRIFAEQKYPADTLQPDEHYDQSWRRLLQDDNAKGGCYVLKIHAVSRWRHNAMLPGVFYINSVRYLIWDRSTRKVHVAIEAFGSNDLRAADRTTICRACHGNDTERRLPPLQATDSLQCESSVYVVNKRTYQLCVLHFPQVYFEFPTFGWGYSYYFTYNGSPTIRGSDYECVPFLRNFNSLKEVFSLEQENCSFRPRDFVCDPSDVRTWGEPIPIEFLSMAEEELWGCNLDGN